MKYKLCIEGENGRINITDKDVIKKISIKVSQRDKSANDRSDKLIGTLTVYGVLNDKSQKETKDIFEWSKKTDKVNVYKTISIQVYNQEELLRDYYLKDIYCESYEEVFDEYINVNIPDKESDTEKYSIGHFVLEMKQRIGSIDTIVIE